MSNETIDLNKGQDNHPNQGQWQQKTIEKLLFENLKEQRRKRRWSIFFKLIFATYVILFLILLLPSRQLGEADKLKSHIALINVKGLIMAGGAASATHVINSLDKAFADSKTIGVIMRINSPGGSPVQAADIYNNIVRLRKKYPNKKIYAVCSDVCTSAAYYIASASDDIYANQASIVGSIGVLLNGFGFVDTIKKLGIQRRLLTSGSEKGFLDPFTPLKAQDKKYAQTMLNIVHEQFIRAVEKGRGQRLKKDPLLFSGLAWTGEQAKQMGLIDGFGSAGFVARHIFKNTIIVNYTKKPGLWEQLSKGIGESFYQQIAANFGLNGDLLR